MAPRNRSRERLSSPAARRATQAPSPQTRQDGAAALPGVWRARTRVGDKKLQERAFWSLLARPGLFLVSRRWEYPGCYVPEWIS